MDKFNRKRVRKIKRLLSSKYDNNKLSVQSGKGVANNWVYIRIKKDIKRLSFKKFWFTYSMWLT